MDPVKLRDVNRHPVAWREAGSTDGDLVIFLHGLGGSRTAWDPQLADLSRAGFRCAAWDMPGYGASAKPTELLTFESLADSVVGWMDALGWPCAHVVGLSLGGMVAQHTALRHPGHVRSLVLLDTSPAFGFDGITSPDEWIEQRLRPMRDGATPASMATSTLRSIMGPSVSGEVLSSAAAAMGRISSAGLAEAVRCVVTHDTRERLSTISARTMVIIGEHDRETPLSYAAHLAAAIPDARLEVIPGAGHISNLEAPVAVNRLLRAFLSPVPDYS